MKGELSREIAECCMSNHIPEKSELFDFIINGRVSLKKYQDVYLLNSVPTLVNYGITKFVVFSHCGVSKDNQPGRFFGGPTLYFYDLKKNEETFRIKGGEALINFSDE